MTGRTPAPSHEVGAGPGTTASGIVLTLYSRDYCHLCHEMLAQVNALRASHGFEVQVADVDTNPEWADLYGNDVPVLFHGTREIARHRLVPGALEGYLRAAVAAAD